MNSDEEILDTHNMDREIFSDEDSAAFEERNEAELRDIYEEDDRDSPREGGDFLGMLDRKKPETREPVIVDRAFVAKLLENDRRSRDNRHFKLIPLSEIQKLKAKYVFRPGDDMLWHDSYCWNPNNDHLTVTERVADMEQYTFPHMSEFIRRGEGHLVAAGGAAMAMASGRFGLAKDLDLFFHSISVEEAEKIVQRIIAWWFSLNTPDRNEYCVYRNARTTTFVDMNPGQDFTANAYQIIHRCYANESEIIGGFDLSSCAVLWNGQDILATEMGTFAIASRMMIVDVSRRSKSFSQRIIKYMRKRFSVCFIAMPHKELLEKFPIPEGKKAVVMPVGEQVRMIYNERNCKILNPLNKGMQPESGDYDGGQEFNLYDMEGTNSLMAAHGNIEAISWGGNKMASLQSIPQRFNYLRHGGDEDPAQIHALSRQYWHEHFHILSPTGQTDALYRWFKAEFLQYKAEHHGMEEGFLTETRLGELGDRVFMGLERAKATNGEPLWLGVNDNPTQQRHTSSFRPVLETISFYNPIILKTLTIGVPHDVFKVIALGRRDRDCGWFYLPRDVFKFLMRYVRDAMAESALPKVD